MEWINDVMNALLSVEGMSATIAVVLEFVLRLLPTKKPLSIAHVVAAVVKGLAKILTKIAEILDSVLPQNSEEK